MRTLAFVALLTACAEPGPHITVVVADDPPTAPDAGADDTEAPPTSCPSALEDPADPIVGAWEVVVHWRTDFVFRLDLRGNDAWVTMPSGDSTRVEASAHHVYSSNGTSWSELELRGDVVVFRSVFGPDTVWSRMVFDLDDSWHFKGTATIYEDYSHPIAQSVTIRRDCSPPHATVSVENPGVPRLPFAPVDVVFSEPIPPPLVAGLVVDGANGRLDVQRELADPSGWVGVTSTKLRLLDWRRSGDFDLHLQEPLADRAGNASTSDLGHITLLDLGPPRAVHEFGDEGEARQGAPPGVLPVEVCEPGTCSVLGPMNWDFEREEGALNALAGLLETRGKTHVTVRYRVLKDRDAWDSQFTLTLYDDPWSSTMRRLRVENYVDLDDNWELSGWMTATFSLDRAKPPGFVGFRIGTPEPSNYYDLPGTHGTIALIVDWIRAE